MILTKDIPLLRKIKAAEAARGGHWFDRGNKRFFNDVEYRGYYGKATGKAYLARSTYKFSDMFGGPKTLSWCINELD